MDFDDLRCVVALGNAMNFGNAAMQLCMTQSALSRRIQAIEKELGYPLFMRSTRSVSFTRAGETFFSGVIDLLRRYDVLVAEASRVSAEEVTTIRIGGNVSNWKVMSIVDQVTSLARTECLPLDFAVRREMASRETSELSPFESDDPLGDENIDIALMFSSQSLEEGPYELVPLYRDAFAAYVSPETAAQLGPSTSLVAMADLTFVETTVYRTYCDRIFEVCRDLGFAPGRIPRFANSMGDLTRFRNENEVLIIPESVAAFVGPVEVSGLVRVPLVDDEAYFDVVAVSRADDARCGVEMAMNALRRLSSLIS